MRFEELRCTRVDTALSCMQSGAFFEHFHWQISAWGNGLARRLPMAKTAGVIDGTLVTVIVKPGHIVIEAKKRANA